MTLEYAILGFLNYQPFTGYDLKKMFDTSVRHFWSADQSQIYRTLSKITEQGLAEMEVVEQTDRPDRKVYHITPAGRQALHAWLLGPFEMDEPRSQPLVQVFFSGQLTNEEILAKFELIVEIMHAVQQAYNQVPERVNEYTRLVGSPRETYFWFSTLNMGKGMLAAQLEWAEQVLKDLREGKVPTE
jgi:DNA-binding PadR family transcriptional regulator